MTGNEFGGGGSGKPCNRGSDGVTIAQNATVLNGEYMQDISAKHVQQGKTSGINKSNFSLLNKIKPIFPIWWGIMKMLSFHIPT